MKSSTELILQNISGYLHLDEEEKALFVSMLQPLTVKRKQLLLQCGDICKYSSFVTQGCLRGFYLDKNGNEHVLSFAPENWWIADMYSLISQKPGILNIEALEETVVLQLSKQNQQKLYELAPKFERFFRIITENSLVAYQQRLMDNLSLTAEERYQNFVKRYPSLVNRLPLKQIATYIGVTPEFFSRMRNDMLKKKG
jgi:CRP-like cAMP-binding protein